MNLNLTVQDIISMLGVTDCCAEPSLFIKKIASIDLAGPDDIAVVIDRGEESVFGAVSIEKINACKAGVILAKKEFAGNKRFIIVNDELEAFSTLVNFIQKRDNSFDKLEYQHKNYFIDSNVVIPASAIVHPSACIASGVAIGENTQIGPHVVVGRGAQIGSNVTLNAGAKILDRCIVGDGTIVHSGAVIGSDGFGYQVTKKGLRKIPQIGIVRIGKMSEIGANCTIDRASFDETVIGNGVKIDNMVHIAHNVKIGDGCAILAQTGIAGSTRIGHGCQIGGQVAIKDNVIIGNSVKIVSKSGVMQNLEDSSVVAGIPSMPFLQWKRSIVSFGKLPELIKQAGEIKQLLAKKENSIFIKVIRAFKKIFS